MTQVKFETKPQILLTCRTHEMLLKEFPQHYGNENSMVAEKEFHTTLGVMETKLQANGFQLYIADNVSYKDYLAMLNYLCENPLKESVYLKMQNEIVG